MDEVSWTRQGVDCVISEPADGGDWHHSTWTWWAKVPWWERSLHLRLIAGFQCILWWLVENLHTNILKISVDPQSLMEYWCLSSVFIYINQLISMVVWPFPYWRAWQAQKLWSSSWVILQFDLPKPGKFHRISQILTIPPIRVRWFRWPFSPSAVQYRNWL